MVNTKKSVSGERIEKFAGDLLIFFNDVSNETIGPNLESQFTRSAAKSILNFGEYQGAESLEFGIRKLGVILKELKEIRVVLKLLAYIRYGNFNKRAYLLQECNDLIAAIETTLNNKRIKVIR